METKLEKIYAQLEMDGYTQEIAWVDGQRHFKGFEHATKPQILVTYYVADGEVLEASTFREFDYV